MDMWYFARICAHARSWREFAKCRFAHFPSFFAVHVDTYGSLRQRSCLFTARVGYFTSPGIDTRQKGPTAFSVSSERHRDKQYLMLRARFLHITMKHAWSGNRTPTDRVTSGRANHYTTASLGHILYTLADQEPVNMKRLEPWNRLTICA